MSKPPPSRPPTYDQAYLEDLATKVYMRRLGPDQTTTMLAKDADGGLKFKRRALAYVPVIKDVLDSMET